MLKEQNFQPNTTTPCSHCQHMLVRIHFMVHLTSTPKFLTHQRNEAQQTHQTNQPIYKFVKILTLSNSLKIPNNWISNFVNDRIRPSHCPIFNWMTQHCVFLRSYCFIILRSPRLPFFLTHFTESLYILSMKCHMTRGQMKFMVQCTLLSVC